MYITNKKNKGAEFYLCFLFLFFPFSFFHSNVMNREIFIKYLTGNTKTRNLKFDTKIGYDKLYCVLENEPPYAYHFIFVFVHFFFLSRKNF